MFERWAVPTLATILHFALLLAAIAITVVSLFSYGLPPCPAGSWFYPVAAVLFLASLVTSSVWMGRLRYQPRLRPFLIALALPAVGFGLALIGQNINAKLQRRCAQWPVDEALAACRADTRVYRLHREANGHPVLTLHAPGETDEAWSCPRQWASHSTRRVSVELDQSVLRR